MTRSEVLFGVAGWVYADWRGVVYPPDCKDTLRAVAQRVDAIEINSTFYGLPSPKNSRSWVERTTDLGTRFTAKLPQEFTHARRIDDDLIARTRGGFAPLWASGRMLGLLAQFDHAFAFSPASIAHVARLAQAFVPDGPLYVEVRHRSWNAAAALGDLAALGVGVLALDYPGAIGGFSRDVPGVLGAGGLAYLRLHGRNQAWFRKGAARNEIYDWRYSADEVEQLGKRIERLGADGARTLVIANNHFHGKAMAVIEDLLRWYRGERVSPRSSP
jgi:uncharacterized protein YecE (DUF72 family)